LRNGKATLFLPDRRVLFIPCTPKPRWLRTHAAKPAPDAQTALRARL